MNNKLDQTQIERIVFQAIDRVNELLLEENAVAKDASTALLGQGAVLDSMGFINFVVALEELLASEAGIILNLVEELNATGDDAPKPETIGQFTGFVFELAQKKAQAD